MDNLIYTEPLTRAKDIFYEFYQKPHHNFFTAKEDALTLINTYVEESEYANHSRALTYWLLVRKEAQRL